MDQSRHLWSRQLVTKKRSSVGWNFTPVTKSACWNDLSASLRSRCHSLTELSMEAVNRKLFFDQSRSRTSLWCSLNTLKGEGWNTGAYRFAGSSASWFVFSSFAMSSSTWPLFSLLKVADAAICFIRRTFFTLDAFSVSPTLSISHRSIGELMTLNILTVPSLLPVAMYLPSRLNWHVHMAFFIDSELDTCEETDPRPRLLVLPRWFAGISAVSAGSSGVSFSSWARYSLLKSPQCTLLGRHLMWLGFSRYSSNWSLSIKLKFQGVAAELATPVAPAAPWPPALPVTSWMRCLICAMESRYCWGDVICCSSSGKRFMLNFNGSKSAEYSTLVSSSSNTLDARESVRASEDFRGSCPRNIPLDASSTIRFPLNSMSGIVSSPALSSEARCALCNMTVCAW